jgi:hypothetical protein
MGISKEEILSSLCVYDKRNPDNVLNLVEDWEKPDYCFCDNCFAGRTRLAEELLNCIEEGGKNESKRT